MVDLHTPVPIRLVLRASSRSPAERAQEVLRVTARAWALEPQRPPAGRYGLSDTRGFHPASSRRP